MYTCAGANSVPVCVSPQDREASKSNAVCWPFIAPCCGFIPSDAPSPLRTPEDSQRYEHISRSILPVSARPVSVCQLPTFSDVTPVQARKGGRYPQNSSREAKIQNYRNSDIDRTIFGGGRNDKGGSKTWLRIPFSLPYCCTFLNCEFKTACAASR